MKTKHPTKIELLRRKFEKESISIVDIVKYFDPTKNRVLTGLLTEMVLEELHKRNSEGRRVLDSDVLSALYIDDKEVLEYIQNDYLVAPMFDRFYYLIGNENRYFLKRFKKYWEEDKLPTKDISQYKTFNDVINTVSVLDIQEFVRTNSIKVEKIYEDEEWLMLLPLSIRASQVYGMGTKWCTSSRDNEYQFYDYTNSGLLVYIIGKTEGRKYAYHKVYRDPNVVAGVGDRISQFFNAGDALADSLDFDIPIHILRILKEFLLNAPYKRSIDHPNYDKETLIKYLASRGEAKLADAPTEAPIQVGVPVIDAPEIPTESPMLTILKGGAVGMTELMPQGDARG